MAGLLHPAGKCHSARVTQSPHQWWASSWALTSSAQSLVAASSEDTEVAVVCSMAPPLGAVMLA